MRFKIKYKFSSKTQGVPAVAKWLRIQCCLWITPQQDYWAGSLHSPAHWVKELLHLWQRSHLQLRCSSQKELSFAKGATTTTKKKNPKSSLPLKKQPVNSCNKVLNSSCCQTDNRVRNGTGQEIMSSLKKLWIQLNYKWSFSVKFRVAFFIF